MIKMIRIRYFGLLKELTGIGDEEFSVEGISSDELLQHLRARGGQWAEALSPQNVFRLVVNQQVIYQSVTLKAGDEVAILPPVTGG